MGYPLTTFHKVPHGRAGTVMLPAFLDFLRTQRIAVEKVTVLDKKFSSAGGIGQFLDSLGVSCRLRDYGVMENELEDYVQKTIVKSDVEITPGEIDRQTIMDIYRGAY
jgi:alcohol dehydrogenase class IV